MVMTKEWILQVLRYIFLITCLASGALIFYGGYSYRTGWYEALEYAEYLNPCVDVMMYNFTNVTGVI